MATDVTSIRLDEGILDKLGVISGVLSLDRSELIRLCIQAGVTALVDGQELVISKDRGIKLTGKQMKYRKVKEIRDDWTAARTSGSTAGH